jgi:hypothetical protein
MERTTYTEGKPMTTFTTTPAATPAFRNAARWLTRQPWQADPAHWVGQAKTRYSLTDHQVAALLHNMQLQLG